MQHITVTAASAMLLSVSGPRSNTSNCINGGMSCNLHWWHKIQKLGLMMIDVLRPQKLGLKIIHNHKTKT